MNEQSVTTEVNMHGYEVVVNADRSDWGKRCGVVPFDKEGCWCYDCTMLYISQRKENEQA